MGNTLTKVATLASMGARSSMLVDTDKVKLALFRIDGELFATQAKCPHANGPLVSADICEKSVTCPWHGWTYDLITGACEEDPGLFLKTYPVRVEGDDIVVEI